MKKLIAQVDIHIDDINFDKEDLAVKRYDGEMFQASKKAFADYAREVKADYFCATQAIWPEYHPQVEIFQFLDWDQYDLVMFADCDVIPNTKEDIFQHCKIDKLNYKHRCDLEIARHGEKDFNSGVVVFGREVMPRVKAKLDLARANKLPQRDQTHMWEMMLDDPTLGHRLPDKFNKYYNITDLDAFLHFKGSMKYNVWPQVRDQLWRINN